MAPNKPQFSPLPDGSLGWYLRPYTLRGIGRSLALAVVLGYPILVLLALLLLVLPRTADAMIMGMFLFIHLVIFLTVTPILAILQGISQATKMWHQRRDVTRNCISPGSLGVQSLAYLLVGYSSLKPLERRGGPIDGAWLFGNFITPYVVVGLEQGILLGLYLYFRSKYSEESSEGPVDRHEMPDAPSELTPLFEGPESSVVNSNPEQTPTREWDQASDS